MPLTSMGPEPSLQDLRPTASPTAQSRTARECDLLQHAACLAIPKRVKRQMDLVAHLKRVGLPALVSHEIWTAAFQLKNCAVGTL